MKDEKNGRDNEPTLVAGITSPSRAGMSLYASQFLAEHTCKTGKIVIVDKGESCSALRGRIAQALQNEVAQFQRVMRVGRKTNSRPTPIQSTPYYRQFDKRKF